MSSQRRLSPTIRTALRCPVCGGELRALQGGYDCADAGCGSHFPVVDGVPVLIDDRASVFSVADFTQGRSTYFDLERGTYRLARGGVATRVAEAPKRRVPDINLNLKGRENETQSPSLSAAGARDFSPGPRLRPNTRSLR